MRNVEKYGYGSAHNGASVHSARSLERSPSSCSTRLLSFLQRVSEHRLETNRPLDPTTPVRLIMHHVAFSEIFFTVSMATAHYQGRQTIGYVLILYLTK